VVSLFTGAGGLDIGLEQAGFRIVAATDCDRDCIHTLRHNQLSSISIPGQRGRKYLHGTKIIEADIRTVHPSELLANDADLFWAPDLLCGGPPCQPFSSAGNMKALSDPRGRLFEHFVRIADALRPRYILFENVRGLVTAIGPKGIPGEAIALVREAFEDIGYATTFALLNAADYGVPQRRVRCFMLGTRAGHLPDFPRPTHTAAPLRADRAGLKPHVTLHKFLARFPVVEDSEIARPSPSLAEQLASLPPGSGIKSAGAREATRPGGHWGYKQGTFVADPQLPARTVTAATSQDWIRMPDSSLRRLSLREVAGLQGFPSQWEFVGGSASRFRQVGNAVPVAFGRVLGEAILSTLNRPQPVEAPVSRPFPAAFTESINYTIREHRANKASRDRVRELTRVGHAVTDIKGLGAQDGHRHREASVTLPLWSSEM